jgi:hypothetical protein
MRKNVHLPRPLSKASVNLYQKLPENISQNCPKCDRKLNHTNAIDNCDLYIVYCMNLKCRWTEVYQLERKTK